jgi:hypothetical protein
MLTCFRNLFLSIVQTQNKVGTSIEIPSSVYQKSSTQKNTFESPKMHANQDNEPNDKTATPGLQAGLGSGATGGVEELGCTTQQKNPHASSADLVIKTYRPFDYEIRDCRISQEYSLVTPFVKTFAKSRSYQSTIIRSSEETHRTSESDVKCVFYPNACGKFLGLSWGLLVSARSTSGWQFSIQPFRAVAEDSLIFEFCRNGNLEGVRALFERREASPWDRDPTGQTPLWVGHSTQTCCSAQSEPSWVFPRGATKNL